MWVIEEIKVIFNITFVSEKKNGKQRIQKKWNLEKYCLKAFSIYVLFKYCYITKY